MILTDLEGLARQAAVSASLREAARFLSRSDLLSLPQGRTTIHSDRVYALASSYQTASVGLHVQLEGHRRYIDIHWLLDGREAVFWAPSASVPIAIPYNEAKDAWNGFLPAERLSLIRLSPGLACVFYPSDAHAPQAADGSPGPVRKIVVKVALEG